MILIMPGHRDKAKQMLNSMERYVATVASPRKEDLNDVWLPFANGESSAPLSLSHTHTHYTHSKELMAHLR